MHELSRHRPRGVSWFGVLLSVGLAVVAGCAEGIDVSPQAIKQARAVGEGRDSRLRAGMANLGTQPRPLSRHRARRPGPARRVDRARWTARDGQAGRAEILRGRGAIPGHRRGIRTARPAEAVRSAQGDHGRPQVRSRPGTRLSSELSPRRRRRPDGPGHRRPPLLTSTSLNGIDATCPSIPSHRL